MLRGHPKDGAERRIPSVAALVAALSVAYALLFGTWVALVGQSDPQDDVAGLVAAAVGVAAVWLVSVQGRALPSFRRGDLVAVARFPGQLVGQTVSVYVATWRRARGYGPPSGFRRVPTDVGPGGGWPAARRSGVVGALASFTPATIVVEVDADTGSAIVHDFVARPEAKA